jgi:hypothetical protein
MEKRRLLAQLRPQQLRRIVAFVMAPGNPVTDSSPTGSKWPGSLFDLIIVAVRPSTSASTTSRCSFLAGRLIIASAGAEGRGGPRLPARSGFQSSTPYLIPRCEIS